MALAAYRQLLRSTRLAFAGQHLAPSSLQIHALQYDTNMKVGDMPLLHAARKEARNGFRKNASLSPEDPALAPAIAHAEEVAKILRENIVQGKLEDDKYSRLQICPM